MVLKTTKVPKYYRISQRIINMICSGNLKPGMQPPSENEIIDKYNVSNITFTNQRSNLAFILGRQGLQCIRVSFLNGFIIHFTPFTYSRPNASNSIGRVCSSVISIPTSVRMRLYHLTFILKELWYRRKMISWKW